MIESFYVMITAVAGFIAVGFLCYLFMRKQEKLLDRIMAKNLEEYQYFDKIVPEEIEETKRLRDEARISRATEDEDARIKDAEYDEEIKALKNFEEEWSGDEVDLEKLRQMNKEG